MTTGAVLLAAGGGSRFSGAEHKLRADLAGSPILRWSIDAMLGADFDEYIVVVGADPFDDLLGGDVTILSSPHWDEGQAHSLQVAALHAAAREHQAIVVGMADQPLVGSAAWSRVASATLTPFAIASFAGELRPPARLAASTWSELPTTGDAGARHLIAANPDLVTVVPVPGDPGDVDTTAALEEVRQTVIDRAAVTELLGRAPQGRFTVAVRGSAGQPVVLRNHPLLDDGRPMPTLYWLCGTEESLLVGRLESMGGVRQAEHDIGLPAIAEAHRVYAAERDEILDRLPLDPDHRPSGGVGGTRTGVKCLHAHYAWWLAGGPDPVGEWVSDHLHEVDYPTWPDPREP